MKPKKWSLGRKVTQFEGFDTFPTPPGVVKVTCTSDEVTATCPVTGQPDWYTVTIIYYTQRICIESKSLKLYLQSFRQKGLFCEAFAAKIAHDIRTALKNHKVDVEVQQKPRGGVAIVSLAISQGP